MDRIETYNSLHTYTRMNIELCSQTIKTPVSYTGGTELQFGH